MPKVIFKNIQYKRDDFNLLTSLELPSGQISVILGPSGSGKTTLLDMCAGFIQPDSGQIFYDSRDMTHTPPEQRHIGVVFQDHALFSHLNVVDNAAFGPRMNGLNKSKALAIAREKLLLVGIEDLTLRMPETLSGGERQRVSIARALANNPSVLLMDEPFSSLDASLRINLRRQVKRIVKDSGITTIFVTHDQNEALALADFLAIIHKGRIVRYGKPSEIWNNPQNRFTATFLGQNSWMKIQSLEKNRHNIIITTSAGTFTLAKNHPGSDTGKDPVALTMRPQFIKPSKDGSLRGYVTHREYSGQGWNIEIIPHNAHEEDIIYTEWQNAPPPPIGSVLFFDIDLNGINFILEDD